MRNFSFFIIVGLMSLVLVGCKNDQQPEQYTFCAGQTYTLQTELQSEGGAEAPRRVYGGTSADNKTPLLWSTNDQINVVMPNGGSFSKSTFTLSSGANTYSGSFTGTAPASGDYYYVLYPGGDGKSVSKNGTTNVLGGYSIPQDQSSIDNVFSKLPMAGYGTGSTFQMTNLGCVLKLKLYSTSGKSISKVTIYSTTSGQYLAGTFNYNQTSIADGTLTATRQDPNSGQYNVYKSFTSHALPTTAANAEEFSFVLAGPVNTTIDLSVQEGGNLRQKSFGTKPLSIGMGEIKTIAPSAGAFDIDTWTISQ